MTSRRRVIGAPGQSRFRVVRRQIAGAGQVARGTSPTISSASNPVSTAIANQQRYDQLQRESATSTYQPATSNVLGHQALQTGYGPQSPGWDPLNDYVPSPAFNAETWASDVARGTTQNSPWAVNNTTRPALPPSHGPISPGDWKSIMANISGTGEDIEGPSRESIQGAIDQAYLGFEQERMKFLQSKEEALRDGKAEVAAQYDAQIRNIDRQIDEFNRELKVSNSVEEWYRNVIQEPFERAKQAALDVNIQPILDMEATSVGRIDEAYRESVGRLDGIFKDLGFDEGKMDAMRQAAALDNPVAAAQMEVLKATAVRPGELEWQKKLAFHTQDALRMSEMRQSAGQQFVTAATRLRDIATSKDRIGELGKERDAAIARTERAVIRAYGDAPLLPSKAEIVDGAMNTMLDALVPEYADREFYRSYAMSLIAANPDLRNFSMEDIIDSVMGGTLGLPGSGGSELAARRRELDEGLITAAQFDSEARRIITDTFDDEDLTILAGLVDTWHTASARADTISTKALSGKLGNGGDDPRNLDPVNQQAARNGDTSNPFGERRQTVEGYADFFRNMGYRVDSGFRTGAAGEGQSTYSDHYTGGALDVFFNSFDAEEMAEYNQRMRPMLEQLAASGIIRYTIHPGDNDAHNDHAHISFNLPSVGHSTVNVGAYNQPSGAAPTATSSTRIN